MGKGGRWFLITEMPSSSIIILPEHSMFNKITTYITIINYYHYYYCAIMVNVVLMLHYFYMIC
uniref:Uncharacterized protein n=1 Tax=Anguilla anguilla TaxID=7936 RepID=A0A0E9WS80_ANGAN